MYNDYDRDDMDRDDLEERLKNASPVERDQYRKKEKSRKKSYFIVALVGALIGGLIAGYLGPKLFASSPGPAAPTENITINPSGDVDIVTAVAKKNMDSVVGITTVELQPYFFMMREVEGVGSGVVVDSDGYILTNSHVVGDGNAQRLEVLFKDGEKAEGKVLWNDRSLDIAIVKVEKKNLKAAELGDSEALDVGELAVAIGNPLGLDFQRSVTAGVVSGLNRTIKAEGITMENLIQTDASINHGNSGGPLLNKQGQVIGINTIKVGSGEGMGFSIPINQIKPIIEDVIKTGDYEGASLGVKVMGVEEFSKQFGVDIDTDSGVVIIQVIEKSTAEKSGLRQLDIIKKIDKKEIKDISILKKSLYDYKKGDTAKFTVERDNKEIEIEVKFD